MRKYHLLLLSLLSGLLFAAAWPEKGFPGFLFLSFVPLLIIEDYFLTHKYDFNKFSIFFYSYPAFFFWNLLTTWWIWNSTPVAVMAWILNAMFMSGTLTIYHLCRRNLYHRPYGTVLFIVFWIAFEHIHLRWELSWPWLNLGHGFASFTRWIQWYEYTGTLGGTLWILIVNVLLMRLYKMVVHFEHVSRRMILTLVAAVVMMTLPVVISFAIYNNYEEEEFPVTVILTQPNLDPYSEQYSIPPVEVVDLNLNLASSLNDPTARFMVCPESAIQESIWESSLDASPSLNRIKEFIGVNPHLSVIIGASTYRRYEPEDKTLTSRFHQHGNFWYDAFNTALFFDTSGIQIHHKSKLTLGVEKMPSWWIFRPLERLAIDLGGTVGTLGVDREQVPFRVNDTLNIAALICYESVYGEYCNRFVQSGARLLFVITNDGWWGDTPGHRQHLTFTPLRAIETRRSIGRSANTGISAFIDQRGNIHQATQYWESAVIRQEMNLSGKLTFYAIYGDYIGRVCLFLATLMLLLTGVIMLRNKKQPHL
ncbi:MAG: apolipoprotein N-acyltransferase [Bacteroidales bacterium]|nr:apolipoprotein N-acyltransferase [Bacteroidales bacterium]